MKLWDLAEFEDLEYLNFYIMDELQSKDLLGSVVICPRGHSLVIPGVEQTNLLTLKVPFGKQLQRLFLAMLHAYIEMESCSTPVCFSACQPGLEKDEEFDWGALAMLNQIFRFVESSRAKEVDFIDLQKLVSDNKIIEIGELGIAFQLEVKRAYSPYVFYHSCIMGGTLLSSGQIRSAGIANAIGLHWRFLLDDNDWQPQCGSGILVKRLERIALLLSKCYVRETSRHYNYESKFWPFLFAACAGWFFRMAINYRSCSNKSASVICLTRAFELALQAQSLHCGAAHLESNGEIFFKDIQLEGCGKIVSLVENKKIKCGIKDSDLNDWAIRARTFLSVRNHSRLAHGIDDIDQVGYAEIMSSSKDLIGALLDLGLYKEFSETCSELALQPFRVQFKCGVSKLLEDYVNY